MSNQLIKLGEKIYQSLDYFSRSWTDLYYLTRLEPSSSIQLEWALFFLEFSNLVETDFFNSGHNIIKFSATYHQKESGFSDEQIKSKLDQFIKSFKADRNIGLETKISDILIGRQASFIDLKNLLKISSDLNQINQLQFDLVCLIEEKKIVHDHATINGKILDFYTAQYPYNSGDL